MLLFSNPNPFSVFQGMFFSPNSKGRENLFWPVMGDVGWIVMTGKNTDPIQLANICLNVKYQGPFELIFYCYYAFPTPYPEDINKIFGKEYIEKNLEPEANYEFRKTVQETSVEAVVTFNRGIFNLISDDQTELCEERLIAGEIIQSQIHDIDCAIPVFLTFPTGWRFHKQYRQLRKVSLDAIKTAIFSRLNLSEARDTEG